MIELTVGYVAGFIAAAVVVAQLLCPTAIALILAGLLKDTETVATWNIASRVLQRSWWPTVLQSDSVLTHGARTRISLVSWSVPIIAVLIAIVGVVTPLGLYEALDTLDAEVGSFVYVKDPGSFGSGTSERGVHNFSRACTWGHGILVGPAPCPYDGNSVILTGGRGNFTFTMPFGYSSKIAPIVREIYSSGTKNRTTVSNFFDIEWRQLSTRQDRFIDNGSELSTGAYRQLESNIMDPSIKIIEGLIVDADKSGVGFRNHTIPLNIEKGASWTEDLLFIEPLASCVNTNLTIDYEITTNRTLSLSGIHNLRLTDRGGFINMNKTYPSYNHANAQSDPDLNARAYKAAWLNNAWTMAYLNVTTTSNATLGRKAWSYLDSELGKGFLLPPLTGVNYRALSIKTEFGSYLDINGYQMGKTKETNWTNPWKVSHDDFLEANVICSGAGAADLANLTNIYVGCGLLRGAPQRVDGGVNKAVFENHSKWSSSLHACAAATRAVVKTVTFTVNGTDGLNSLKVTSISPKNYTSPDDVPLWGLEDSGLSMEGINPVWGIISPEYASRPNISTVKQPYFHLPGYTSPSLSITLGTFDGNSVLYNIPGSDFPSKVMNLIFGGSYGSDGAMEDEWPFDLKGAANMPVFNRWQALSNDSSKVSEILRLIWTDLAASAVVGTKGALGLSNSGAADEAAVITIRPVGNRIKYRWAFGIPAFVLLLVMASIFAFILIFIVFHTSAISVIRHRMQQLTIGRILTTFLYPERSNLVMPSKEWSQWNGDKVVNLGGVPEKSMISAVEPYSSQYPPETPAEEVRVGLMGGGKKIVY
ncbi:hypothetical protein EsH8_II_001489 [Colletotrichum jinshuiense]